jgi:predicted ester cyclase
MPEMNSSTITETGEQYSTGEQRNIDLVTEYMNIAYDPKRASDTAVAHLCAPGNRFVAPTTFPQVHTLEEYAEEHRKLMKQIEDLHVVSFEVLFAKDDRVCMRYTAEGTHGGEPHGNTAPSGKKAQWTACCLFRIQDGRIIEAIKEWNKLVMWEQFDWPTDECYSYRGQ